jgi:hypothetical protein
MMMMMMRALPACYDGEAIMINKEEYFFLILEAE